MIVRARERDPGTPISALGEDVLTDAEGSYRSRFTDTDVRVGDARSADPYLQRTKSIRDALAVLRSAPTADRQEPNSK